MDTAPHTEIGIDDASTTVLWDEAEQQLGEVLRVVRLLDCDMQKATAPLLDTLRILTRQAQSNGQNGQLERTGRFLARVLGTMLYAPELAGEAERLADQLLRCNEHAEEPEDLLLLQAALAVMQYQTGIGQEGGNARIAAALQGVTAALDVGRNPVEAEEAPVDTFLYLLAGCLSYISGRLDQTLELYERYGFRVSRAFPLWHDLFCMYTSHAALYCHRFPMSLGIVESFRNTAEITGSNRQSLIWRVHLSFLLLRMDRLQEALPHIDHVLTVAASSGIRLISVVGSRALALYHYKNGNAEAAARLLASGNKTTGSGNHIVSAVTDPVVMEMLFDLQVRQGFSIPNHDIEQELHRLEQGPNSFLCGIGLCLRGRLALGRFDRTGAAGLFRRGFQELLHSGSLSECCRAGRELEHLLGELGLHDEQRRFQERLSRMQDALAQENAGTETGHTDRPDVAPLRRCLAALAVLPMTGTSAENLSRLAGVLRRELSAQRVVLLRGTPCGGFEYAAGSSFTPVEARSVEFRNTLLLLQNACRQATPEQPVLWRQIEHGVNMAMGLAVFVAESMPWLLYMDNSLGTGEFEACLQEAVSLFCAALAAEIRGTLRGGEPPVRAESLSGTAPTRVTQGRAMPPLFGTGLQAVLDDAERAAETSASVLILGETGVGKEILARYIHERSGCSGLFVPVHLACISEHLFESELFGHEKGAFTGAVRAKTGLVELARNGVLFLDEVGDIPLPFQVKLLRFLQEREFMRVGGVQVVRANFRLITATNRDLLHEVREGRFREDLYHRLAVIPLRIPPLRERRADILPLAHAFRRHYAELHQRAGHVPADAQLATLMDRPWPGNIRELQGVLERAVVLERWPEDALPASGHGALPDAPPPATEPAILADAMVTFPTAEALLQKYIRRVLDKTGGKIYGPDGAAAILGMNKSTLYARMKKMGI